VKLSCAKYGYEVPHLVIDFPRLGNGLPDFSPQDFAKTLPQTVNGNVDSPVAIVFGTSIAENDSGDGNVGSVKIRRLFGA